MTRIALCLFVFLHFIVHSAAAQDQQAPDSFVQIEFHPDLAVTRQAALAYAAQLDDVNGFSMGAGWYAVALGPYTPGRADRVMARLRDRGLIPPDSFVARGSDYERRFWPRGTPDRSAAATGPEIVQLAQAQGSAETLPEETRYEARLSEQRLSRQERMDLQVALKWAGYYDGAIDAAIGPGTRAAMSGWQAANGHEPTGVLTTRQRAELLRQYNAVLEGLDLRTVRDTETGIEMKLPTAAVTFEKYEPPFAHFNATGAVPGARVLLISQPGNRNTLVGLYDIMQTLRIVPQKGERGLDGDGFTLVGENDRIVSHTEAALRNGRIKGFTLIWPTGDEDRRTRLLAAMRDSFSRISGVLDPGVASAQANNVDLVSGLEVRRPELSRSGFFADGTGTVVTTLQAVEGCGRVTIDEDYQARVVTTDADLGVAVLRPVDSLSPVGVAAFRSAPPRRQSEVAVSGYSYGGLLGAPTLTYGRLADIRGLDGEDRLDRLALDALEGDAGGPVVDSFGAVIGMLLPEDRGARQLPDGVRFTADAEALTALLSRAGVTANPAGNGQPLPPETLAKRAAEMTVLVSCWE